MVEVEVVEVAGKPLISPGYMEARKFGIGPDFKVYTGAMKPLDAAYKAHLPETDQDKPILRMRGSSTIMDLQEDMMSMEALHSMTRVDPGLSLWLNHSYELPEDLFGKLYDTPTIEVQRNLADLWIMGETILRNPRAEQTYHYIVLDKTRAGCSVGCQVLKWHHLVEDDYYSPIVIDEVYVVEWSVVPIPANQRCWVENAIKGLFAGALRDGNGDEALRLAPAFKSLYSKDFSSVAENVTSAALRRELERVRPRGVPATKRIMYTWDKEEGFYLEERGLKKSLTREETMTLLECGLAHPAAVGDEQEDGDMLTKAVGGKTAWPLLDIDTEWTGATAEKQIFDYARNDDGEIVASKASQCFLYTDPDNNDKQSGYKLPYVYVQSDEPKIVPLGVRAVGNILAGGMGGLKGVSDNDVASIKSKVKTMYNRINKELKPDPEWVVPWEKEDSEKSLYDTEQFFLRALGFEVVESGDTFYVKSADGTLVPWLSKDEGILSTENGGGTLVRQDVEVEEEQVDGNEEEFVIKADGTHAAFTGPHTHAHPTYGSQGDDAMHEHVHTHDGDANHGHHDAESSDETEKSGGQSVEKTADATPLQAEQETAETSETDTPVTKALDAVQRANLSLYNHIGDLLKLAPITEEQYLVKCNLVQSPDDAQQVISLVSSLDSATDNLTAQVAQVEYTVDALMNLLSIPDADGGYGAYYDSFTPGTIKEGKEISAKNQAHLQTIHDAVKAMHPDCCTGGVSGDGTAHQDGSQTVEGAQQQAIAMGEGDTYDRAASIASLDRLSKAFETFDVKAAVDVAVKKEIAMAMQGARTEIDHVLQSVAALKQMPLGNPLTHHRSVVKDNRGPMALDNIATYDEMLSAGGTATPQTTLAEALAQTQIVKREVTTANGMVESSFRHWPQGVGGAVGQGVRPPLTNAQKKLMHINEWDDYTGGQDAHVPMIDDPAGLLA